MDTSKSSNGSCCPDKHPGAVPTLVVYRVDTRHVQVQKRPLYCRHDQVQLKPLLKYYIEAGNKNLVDPIVWPSSIANEISEV